MSEVDQNFSLLEDDIRNEANYNSFKNMLIGISPSIFENVPEKEMENFKYSIPEFQLRTIDHLLKALYSGNVLKYFTCLAPSKIISDKQNAL